MGTFVVTVILIAIVVAIIKKMIQDKKKGISPQCGCSCKDCSGHCH